MKPTPRFPLAGGWMHTAIARLLAAALTACVVGGCEGISGGGGPAVVDAVSVARALGRDEVIQTKLNDATQLLNSQLSQISNNLQKQLEDEQKKLGSSDAKKMEDLTVQSQIRLRRTQMLAKQKASDFRSNLLLEFRNEIKSVAAEIAKSRGYSSVMLVNGNLLWYDPSVDITADVIRKLRANGGKPATTPEAAADAPSGGAARPTAEAADKQEVKALNQLMDKIENKVDESASPAESGTETQ